LMPQRASALRTVKGTAAIKKNAVSLYHKWMDTVVRLSFVNRMQFFMTEVAVAAPLQGQTLFLSIVFRCFRYLDVIVFIIGLAFLARLKLGLINRINLLVIRITRVNTI
jgi:hypothetical protein